MTHPLVISSKMNRRAWLRGSVAVAAATIAVPRSSAAGEAVAGTGEKIMLSDAAVADLAKSLTGDVVLPTSADYDEVRKVWNPAGSFLKASNIGSAIGSPRLSPKRYWTDASQYSQTAIAAQRCSSAISDAPSIRA